MPSLRFYCVMLSIIFRSFLNFVSLKKITALPFFSRYLCSEHAMLLIVSPLYSSPFSFLAATKTAENTTTISSSDNDRRLPLFKMLITSFSLSVFACLIVFISWHHFSNTFTAHWFCLYVLAGTNCSWVPFISVDFTRLNRWLLVSVSVSSFRTSLAVLSFCFTGKKTGDR